MSEESCCRGPVGGDMKFFDSLSTVLDALEARGSDKLMMDMTITTKRKVYERLIAQAQRLSDSR